MLQLHSRLQQRYPQWFDGRRARLARPVLRSVARFSRLDTIEHFLHGQDGRRGLDFVRAALAFLQASYQADATALARIPASGRLLIVANHPSGALDALALLDAVGRVRDDVRIVANDLLSALEPLSELLLPVRILGGRPAASDLQAIGEALRAEQCVIMFPAGEVSRLGLRGVRDTRWRKGFVRLARDSGAPVLPVRIVARNSALFYGASAVFKPAGTALLAREMFARRRRPLSLHVGRPMQPDFSNGTDAVMATVRQAVYALGRRAGQAQERLSPPADRVALAAAVAQLELLGCTTDGKQIRIGRLPANSTLMRELGRERERTFREVGEGTGNACDMDAFDPHYLQIVLWDEARCRVAGGYRVMPGAQALARHGLAGLYTAALFRYADDAIPRLAQGIELGRSFVCPEYWGSRSLDYLWQGIGAYLQRHPGVRYLFGPVSISAAMPLAAREQLVAYYQRYYGATDALADSMRPFRYFAAPPDFSDMDAATAFEVLRNNLAALGAGVPVLYKQYTDLCEPGGARFLAFGVDPEFSDAIDGLIEVDLQRLLPRKRRRYLQSGASGTPVEARA
ncbi:MAG: GNAT family N-acyltransferase [Pseudoxanthomonas suwonensis]|nr:GNAT family N-acyltransferase [Pseudoxanthomonas suwonensis]